MTELGYDFIESPGGNLAFINECWNSCDSLGYRPCEECCPLDLNPERMNVILTIKMYPEVDDWYGEGIGTFVSWYLTMPLTDLDSYLEQPFSVINMLDTSDFEFTDYLTDDSPGYFEILVESCTSGGGTGIPEAFAVGGDYQNSDVNICGAKVEDIYVELDNAAYEFCLSSQDCDSTFDSPGWLNVSVSGSLTIELSDSLEGCTYPCANNYNAQATDDDGSCEFLSSSSSGDLNNDGDVTIIDVISLVNMILYNPDIGSYCDVMNEVETESCSSNYLEGAHCNVCGNVNDDDRVDVVDVGLVVDIILGA